MAFRIVSKAFLEHYPKWCSGYATNQLYCLDFPFVFSKNDSDLH